MGGMTDAEFDAMMNHNPHLKIIEGERLVAATLAQKHAITQRTKELLAEPHEDEMQAAVIAWADAQTHPALRWLAHVPNGGYRPKSTLGSISGVKRGVPDLVLWWRNGDCPGVCIEMKRRPNKPTLEQECWLAHLEHDGWRCEVCYSADAAIAIIAEYLDIAS
jgi:hypothetical protein